MKNLNKKIVSFAILSAMITVNVFAADRTDSGSMSNSGAWMSNLSWTWLLYSSWNTLTGITSPNVDELSKYLWTGSLDGIILDYEKDLKNSKNTKKLDTLYKEKNNFKSRKISSEMKDDILNQSFLKTKRNKIKDTISKDFADTNAVMNTLVSSMKKQKKELYRLLVRSTLSLDDLKNTMSFFDTAEINYVNDSWDKKVYEVLLPYSGKIAKIIWKWIESGELPENLFPNIEVIQPFAVKVNSDTTYLSGELLNNIWGITKIWAQDYQKWLSNKQKVKIWIIDTWIDYNNLDLASNIYKNPSEIAGNALDDDKNGYIDDVNGYNFVANNGNSLDDHGHGTHVSWIAWAKVNGKWVFWVNSNAYLIPLKVLDKSWAWSSYSIVDAINYAANNGIKVINLSLGWNGNPLNDVMCNAITQAKAKWVITIVAAGNENADVNAKVPAWCSDAITVWAVDSNLKKASFSNYGNEVDVSAPGVGIYSTVLNNSYASWNGTSMATPFVAWLVSSILANNPNVTYTDVKQILVNNSDSPVSTVNIWKFINMTKVMTYLSVSVDSNSGTIIPPTTGSGSTGTWVTSTGTLTPPPTTWTWTTGTWGTSTGNILPLLTLTSTKVSINKYTLSVQASDTDGKIVSSILYKDNVQVSTGTSYTLDIIKDTTISVTVIDDKGWKTTKSIVLKYENPPVIIPPVVNISPVITFTTWIYNARNNYVLISGNDKDGKITKEDIYINWKLTYSYTFNSASTKLYLYYTKWYKFTLKVAMKDNKWWISEKSLDIK